MSIHQLSEAPKSRLQDQVRLKLELLIASGELAPGTLLESEAQLCAKFGISRVTLRLVLADLQGRGIIGVRRGVGRYVEPDAANPRQCLRSYTTDGVDHGLEIRSCVVGYGPVPDTTTVAAVAELPNVPKWLLGIERIRYVNDAPWAFSQVFVSEAYSNLFTPDTLSGSGQQQSLLSYLQSNLGEDFYQMSGFRRMRITGSTQEIAQHLNIGTSHPLMRDVCTMYDHNSHLVFVDVTYSQESLPSRVAVHLRQENQGLSHTDDSFR